MQFAGFGITILWLLIVSAVISIGPLLVNWRFSSSLRADISTLRRDMAVLSDKLDRLERRLDDENS